jgi:hypothetical protein
MSKVLELSFIYTVKGVWMWWEFFLFVNLHCFFFEVTFSVFKRTSLVECFYLATRFH